MAPTIRSFLIIFAMLFVMAEAAAAPFGMILDYSPREFSPEYLFGSIAKRQEAGACNPGFHSCKYHSFHPITPYLPNLITSQCRPRRTGSNQTLLHEHRLLLPRTRRNRQLLCNRIRLPKPMLHRNRFIRSSYPKNHNCQRHHNHNLHLFHALMRRRK